ncbi:phosphodiester glycosidase family protein [Sesbania bispinosa]|nr:phosphodiester glycosidase family protein [Sesbania bispinosa]
MDNSCSPPPPPMEEVEDLVHRSVKRTKDQTTIMDADSPLGSLQKGKIANLSYKDKLISVDDFDNSSLFSKDAFSYPDEGDQLQTQIHLSKDCSGFWEEN